VKLRYVVIALSAALTSLPALTNEVGGNRVDQCQRLFQQMSECYSAAQRAEEPDHVEGAELQCDAMFRARSAACETTASMSGTLVDRPKSPQADVEEGR
jgi:hypothetical protein